MTIDAVEVLAGCITDEGNGIYQASGDTHFGDGASIVDTGTQTPASLVLDPAAHTISIAPAVGGGAQSGELEADGVDVATGDLVIHTQAVTDPISGIAGSAPVTGIGSVDLALSGWTFSDVGWRRPLTWRRARTAVGRSPTAAGAAVVARGRDQVRCARRRGFGSRSVRRARRSGQLVGAVERDQRRDLVQGEPARRLIDAAGQRRAAVSARRRRVVRVRRFWGSRSLVKLNVNGVISEGKLDDLTADFSCSTSKICGTAEPPDDRGDPRHQGHRPEHDQPPGESITPRRRRSVRSGCRSRVSRASSGAARRLSRRRRVDGAVIIGIFGDRMIAGGDFDYLLDGQFTASGGVGLAPFTAGRSPIRRRWRRAERDECRRQPAEQRARRGRAAEVRRSTSRHRACFRQPARCSCRHCRSQSNF